MYIHVHANEHFWFFRVACYSIKAKPNSSYISESSTTTEHLEDGQDISEPQTAVDDDATGSEDIGNELLVAVDNVDRNHDTDLTAEG